MNGLGLCLKRSCAALRVRAGVSASGLSGSFLRKILRLPQLFAAAFQAFPGEDLANGKLSIWGAGGNPSFKLADGAPRTPDPVIAFASEVRAGELARLSRQLRAFAGRRCESKRAVRFPVISDCESAPKKRLASGCSALGLSEFELADPA